ncbi:MAG: hypothetical protein ACRETB_03540 [Steroidobacteraceae bacterium]
MSIETRQESSAEGSLPASVVHAAERPQSSRMLESYLADIEYLMRAQLWTRAAVLALALPHICAALSSADLVSSVDAYRAWCENWVRPLRNDTSLTAPSTDELERIAAEYAVEPELVHQAGVPVRALRQLRLRRLSRAALPRGRAPLALAAEASSERASEACRALLRAVRRWYRDWAARDPVSQTNLARLAVLR